MSNEVEIKTSNTLTIDMLGEDGAVKAKYNKAKSFAEQCGGKILREDWFEGGIFFEVHFTDETMMNVWKNNVGVKHS